MPNGKIILFRPIRRTVLQKGGVPPRSPPFSICPYISVDIVDILVVFPFRLCLRLRGDQSGTLRCGHHSKAIIKKIADIAEIVRVVFVLPILSVFFALIQKITSRSDFRSRDKSTASFLLFPKGSEKPRKMLFISKFHLQNYRAFRAFLHPQDSLLSQ